MMILPIFDVAAAELPFKASFVERLYAGCRPIAEHNGMSVCQLAAG
jgi:hypothetical protein